METKQVTKSEKLISFSKEDLTSSKNKKLKEVGKFLSNDRLMERINSYSETYWDKQWSDKW